MSTNVVVMVGRLTKDPDLTMTRNGFGCCKFTLAVDRTIKVEGQSEADFVNCVAFKQTAKFMTDYLKKGYLISVEGAIRTGNYEKDDGTKVYTTDVVCHSVQNLTPREKGEEAPQEANEEKLEEVFGDTLEITSDDLPF